MVKKNGKKTLVIERLSLITFVYTLLNFWKFSEIIYFQRAPIVYWRFFQFILAKLKMQYITWNDYPGSYFIIQKEACLNANDKFYYANKDNNPLVDFLSKYKSNKFVELALRKSILKEYTLQKVNAYYLLKKIMEESGGEIIFIPADIIEFSPYLSKEFVPPLDAYKTPVSILLTNRVIDIIGRLNIFTVSTVFMIYSFTKRGVTLNTPEPQIFDFGFDIFSYGANWGKLYYDRFLYDENKFKPETILHVVRKELEDERTREYFEKEEYPYVEAGKLKIPLSYFIKRYLLEFYIPFNMAFLRLLSIKRNFIHPVVMMVYYITLNEILYSHYKIKVFIARDEYSPKHIIRTIIANEKGGKTIGFMHGDECTTVASTMYYYFDYFCIWGEFYKEVHKKSLAPCKNVEIIGGGIFGLDKSFKFISKNKIPRKYSGLKQKYKIITVFGSSFNPEGSISEELTLHFYTTVLSLLDKYGDIFIVIKPKYDEFKNEKFLRLLKNRDRVSVEEDIWTYGIIPIGDLMICIKSTTVGLEGIIAGKKVLYFDVTNFKDHPYRKYDKHLVSFTSEEFYKNVEWVLSGNYLSKETLESIRKRHGFKFDGHVADRLRSVAIKALEGVP